MTQINNAANTAWPVGNVNANTFSLTGTNGPTYSAYTNGGTAYCTRYGCQYLALHQPNRRYARLRRHHLRVRAHWRATPTLTPRPARLAAWA